MSCLELLSNNLEQKFVEAWFVLYGEILVDYWSI